MAMPQFREKIRQCSGEVEEQQGWWGGWYSTLDGEGLL